MSENADIVHPQMRSSEIFRIVNTAHNAMLVIASSWDRANMIARDSNHILDIRNGSTIRVKLSEFEDKAPKFAVSLSHALSSGAQGIVSQRGNCAVLGRRVFTPQGEAE